MPDGDDGALLLKSLDRVARDMVRRRDHHDLEETVSAIVQSAVRTVPGADVGGLTVTENSRVSSRHPTGDELHGLDELQSRLGEGPCITAAENPPEDGLVYAPDLASDECTRRWPRFAPEAVERGFRSLLSTQLATRDGLYAALNLYSHRPDAFDESARMLAGLFGLQAAVLLYGAHNASHLHTALETRDLIGQAKGILQERFDVDEDRAFAMLARSSQDTNMKLVAVARWLVENRGATRAAGLG